MCSVFGGPMQYRHPHGVVNFAPYICAFRPILVQGALIILLLFTNAVNLSFTCCHHEVNVLPFSVSV